MSDPFDIDDDKPKLPVVVPLENDEKFLRLWMHLDERKRTFLLTWQECNYSERAAAKKLKDTTQTYRRWANNCEAYRVCRKILRDTAMAEALDKGRLVIENKKIVGLALAKKPILYQGQPTGFFERDLGTALRGNEQLMRAGGHLKEEKQETSYAHGPALVIQVLATDGSVQIAQVNNGIEVRPPTPSFLEIDDVNS